MIWQIQSVLTSVNEDIAKNRNGKTNDLLGLIETHRQVLHNNHYLLGGVKVGWGGSNRKNISRVKFSISGINCREADITIETDRVGGSSFHLKSARKGF